MYIYNCVSYNSWPHGWTELAEPLGTVGVKKVKQMKFCILEKLILFSKHGFFN